MPLPDYLSKLVGQKPTSEKIAAELTKAEAALAAAPARIEAADAAMTKIAGMTDEEHKQAIEATEAARRDLKRCEVRVADARAALVIAQKDEAAAALIKRRNVVQRRVDGDYGKLLDKLDIQMAAVAETAAQLREIENESGSVNDAIFDRRRKDNADYPAIDPVESPFQKYFTEPPTVTPDRTVTEKVWRRRNGDGRWTGVSVFGERNGEQVPLDPSAQLQEVERVIPGETRPGRRISLPTFDLVLPATRLGGVAHWPKRG